MDKIINDESIFDEESPFTAYSVEKYVLSQTGKCFFFKQWIRPDCASENSVIILTANNETDETAIVKISKNESGFYLEFSKILKHSL